MKWWIEVWTKKITHVDEDGNISNIHKKAITHFYSQKKPKKSKIDGITQIEINSPPNDFNYQPWYEVDFTDETKTDVEWKVNRDIWLNEYVRPTREPLMQKALNKIDQYKNETDQLDYRIITERSLSDAKYQEWLTYVRDLRDITDTIEYGNEQWPKEPK